MVRRDESAASIVTGPAGSRRKISVKYRAGMTAAPCVPPGKPLV
nr:hypothetical protein [Paenibacillus humicola]